MPPVPRLRRKGIHRKLQTGTAPQPSYSFNTSTKQITAPSGYTYDAAGNMTSDGTHTYTYDAEGNIVKVDSGTTAAYLYDALNHRARTVVGSAVTEFVFNQNGQRVSAWNATTKTVERDQYYWGGKPVAFAASGATHFQHQDWLGTERARTAYDGTVEGTYASLPFGDGYTASGTDQDPYHYAQLDYDSETTTDSTEHAQFRQYSASEATWMSPDPYSGSYDSSNPQSLNRYAYVLNNPIGFIDPLGLETRSICDAPADFDPEGGGDKAVTVIGYSPTCEEDPGEGFAGTMEGYGVGGYGGGAAAINANKSSCIVSEGRTTGVGPGQAPGPGAFGFVPPAGSVAIDPVALGLPPGGSTNALLGPYASQITFTFSPAPNLPQGYPTTHTLGSIVGGPRNRIGGSNFNGLFDFDFYGLPSLTAAYNVTSQPGVAVSVTVTYPSSLPIVCDGQILDSPMQNPLPTDPAPVSAMKGRPE